MVGYGASSYSNYLGHERCVGVEAVRAVTGSSEPDLSVADLLERDRPFAVLVTDDWRYSAVVDDAPLQVLVASGAWRWAPVAVGELYWRAEMADEAGSQPAAR